MRRRHEARARNRKGRPHANKLVVSLVIRKQIPRQRLLVLHAIVFNPRYHDLEHRLVESLQLLRRLPDWRIRGDVYASQALDDTPQDKPLTDAHDPP